MGYALASIMRSFGSFIYLFYVVPPTQLKYFLILFKSRRHCTKIVHQNLMPIYIYIYMYVCIYFFPFKIFSVVPACQMLYMFKNLFVTSC